MPMNIAFDARALVGRHTGVGTWTTRIASGLADAGHRIQLAASRPLDLPPELDRDTVDVVRPPGLPLPGTAWLHLSLPKTLRRVGADVLVGSLAIVPRRCSIPCVAMVHDLTPLTHPKNHTPAVRWTFNPFIAASLDRATAVVVGSEATRDVVSRHFPFVVPKIRLISYGVDPFFSPPDDPTERERTQREFAGGRPYILHLGTLEPRKGLVTLVDAWDRLHDLLPDPPCLVLAGRPGWDLRPLDERIDRSPGAERIVRPGYVNRDQARALMRHAAAFVLASEAEGFGLPLAEAVACGAPAVASDIPALRESGGPSVCYVPPGDADALAAALASLIGQGSEPAATAQGAQDIRLWDDAVSRWEDLLKEVTARPTRA